jgi:4-amino-4-deoxy-L-arabinose transferase-like glycosyltransferase
VLAGLLLAAEPFLAAHDRLLHADPLLGHLMAFAVLAALLYFQRGGRLWLLVAGLASGLALLTKAPAIFLFGFIPLLGLVQRAWARPRAPRWPLTLGLELLVWGLAAGLIFIALWPALWADPPRLLARLLADVRLEGETARPNGNFFFGQPVLEDVGPLFYPVVTLLRLSPVTLLGLVLLAGFGLWRGGRRQVDGRPGPVVISDGWSGPILALVAYVVLFSLMMTISPKKIDRYLLPIYPVLVVLAALGLDLALRQILRAEPLRWAAVGGLGLSQAALLASVQPYPLSFFNPLLGGSQVARQVVIVGWGEGTDQAAAYLDAQPDAEQIVVTSLYAHLIDAQFRGGAARLADWREANYLADYVNMRQRDLLPVSLRRLTRSARPEFTVRINGLDYLWIYRIPPELK